MSFSTFIATALAKRRTYFLLLNVVPLIALVVLLVRYGHIPPPLASPDEFRLDFLVVLVAPLILFGFSLNAAGFIFTAIQQKGPQRSNAFRLVLALSACWAVATLAAARFTG